MTVLKSGKKMTVGNLSANKKLLQKFVSPSFIKNRTIGKIVVGVQHSFEPTLYTATNEDGTEAVYSYNELKNIQSAN